MYATMFEYIYTLNNNFMKFETFFCELFLDFQALEVVFGVLSMIIKVF